MPWPSPRKRKSGGPPIASATESKTDAIAHLVPESQQRPGMALDRPGLALGQPRESHRIVELMRAGHLLAAVHHEAGGAAFGRQCQHVLDQEPPDAAATGGR